MFPLLVGDLPNAAPETVYSIASFSTMTFYTSEYFSNTVMEFKAKNPQTYVWI